MYINSEKHLKSQRVKIGEGPLVRKSRALKVRVDRKRLERLPFLCQAMWELLKEATFLEDEDLIDKMDRMDLLDSFRTGKIRLSAVKCEACGRNTNSERKTCIYCGHKLKLHSKRIFLDNPALL